jgi:ribose 5-phosphate isomerase A
MTTQERKARAARAALDYVRPKLDRHSVIGVGTGSTTNAFIDLLGSVKHIFDAAVASSIATAERLKALGIAVIDLNAAPEVVVYVDGADEVNTAKQLIKGGGGALTREKIIATSAREFVCIVDDTKIVPLLGNFPLPVEVIPMARGLVARALVGLGGQPVYRERFVTDNGNLILDVHGLDLTDPGTMEHRIDQIVGVVGNGIFAARRADRVAVASEAEVRWL